MRSSSYSSRYWFVFAVVGLLFLFSATGAWAANVPVTAASLNAGTPPSYNANDTLKITGALTTTTPGGWNTLKNLSVAFHLELDSATTTIPDGAMEAPWPVPNTAIQSITANSVTSVGNQAFAYCTSLASVSLPLVTDIADGGAFARCMSLTSVSLPKATNVGSAAFYDSTNLVSVSLPVATNIGDAAFEGCTKLTAMTLPAATNIGKTAFRDCTNLASVSLPVATDIGYSTFEDCTRLTSLSLPKAVHIDDEAFRDCTNLVSVSLPVATDIGAQVFYQCENLKNVSLPVVTSIGDVAFGWCTSLTALTLPSTVASIGEEAFDNCASLTSVTIQATVPPTLGPNVFSNTPSSLQIKVPEASVNAYKTSWAAYASRIIAISSGSGGTTTVTGVTLNKTTLDLKIGETGQLAATVAPSDATSKDVTWTTSNANVATVDQNGKVTAIGQGTATITATTVDGGKTATCTVTVTQSGSSNTVVTIDLSNLGLENGVLKLDVNELYSAQLKATPTGTTFSATGLPQGLPLTSGGLLSGSVPTEGTYNVTLTATAPDGTKATQTFVVQVKGGTATVTGGGSSGCNTGLLGELGILLLLAFVPLLWRRSS